MLSRLALILVVAACGSCMEMRETVERMVMVRTTGSDLQPAASGYIYKKKNDGKESVIEMGESEIMEQLAKLYEQPKSEERIIPVKEKQEDHVDGIADDDYKKIFDEYTSHYGDSKAYDDYLRSLSHFGDGLYSGYEGDNKHDDEGFKGYNKKQRYGDGKAGDYHNEKYESYAYSGSDRKGDETKVHEKHNGHNQNEEDGKKSSLDKADAHGFYKVFDKDDNQRQKDHQIYDNKDKIGFHKFANGHKYHGEQDRGYDKDGSHESRHEVDFGRSGHHDEGSGTEADSDHSSEEKKSSSEKHGDYGSKVGQIASRGYGFKIKH
ncbi:uncharacterized protein LOC126776279 [Nymphalis io]|uniref:uncharacterized protein LOC126776279 n=1 Tax=Inachis io TaxID=171585 RepID=UPI0021691A35|nr:uncharacterized protein LOC126776279 [Nymphalis io]